MVKILTTLLIFHQIFDGLQSKVSEGLTILRNKFCAKNFLRKEEIPIFWKKFYSTNKSHSQKVIAKFCETMFAIFKGFAINFSRKSTACIFSKIFLMNLHKNNEFMKVENECNQNMKKLIQI